MIVAILQVFVVVVVLGFCVMLWPGCPDAPEMPQRMARADTRLRGDELMTWVFTPASEVLDCRVCASRPVDVYLLTPAGLQELQKTGAVAKPIFVALDIWELAQDVEVSTEAPIVFAILNRACRHSSKVTASVDCV